MSAAYVGVLGLGIPSDRASNSAPACYGFLASVSRARHTLLTNARALKTSSGLTVAARTQPLVPAFCTSLVLV